VNRVSSSEDSTSIVPPCARGAHYLATTSTASATFRAARRKRSSLSTTRASTTPSPRRRPWTRLCCPSFVRAHSPHPCRSGRPRPPDGDGAGGALDSLQWGISAGCGRRKCANSGRSPRAGERVKSTQVSLGWLRGSTPPPNSSPMPAMPLRCMASGIWATPKAGCRTIKDSTSGGASRTHGTRRAIPRIRCSRRAAFQRP
jgi:hypothetical protein